jgi:hypothetical protein
MAEAETRAGNAARVWNSWQTSAEGRTSPWARGPLRERNLADDGGAAGRRGSSRERDGLENPPGDLVVGDDGSDLKPAAASGAAPNVNVKRPRKRSERHASDTRERTKH